MKYGTCSPDCSMSESKVREWPCLIKKQKAREGGRERDTERGRGVRCIWLVTTGLPRLGLCPGL